MTDMEFSELEVFITLSEELHFGRTAQRLYLSQGRVSQLLRSLETRVGAELFSRTSRRVNLTPLGAGYLARVRPAVESLRTALAEAQSHARGSRPRLHVGFVGTSDIGLVKIVAAFREAHPQCDIILTELRLNDPFSAVQRGELDAVFACLPVSDPSLVVGPVLSRVPVVLTVAADHPFASRQSVTAEELAEVTMVDLKGPAPRDWQESMSPRFTPGGRRIATGPEAGTHQEVLSLIATGQGALVMCEALKVYGNRRDLAYIPIEGLPESSYALIWRRGGETALLRDFATVTQRVATADPAPQPA